MKEVVIMGVCMNMARPLTEAMLLQSPPPLEPTGADRFKTMNGRQVKTQEGLIFNVKEK